MKHTFINLWSFNYLHVFIVKHINIFFHKVDKLLKFLTGSPPPETKKMSYFKARKNLYTLKTKIICH